MDNKNPKCGPLEGIDDENVRPIDHNEEYPRVSFLHSLDYSAYPGQIVKYFFP